MAGRTIVQAPEKELRFTRSAQAAHFWIIAAILTAAAMTILLTAVYRDINPQLPHPLWAVLPMLLAFGFGKIAVNLTKHAYLILTPLGIEVFPFYRPAAGMRLVVWQEIDSAEVDDRSSLLTLHFTSEKKSGIRLSLKPIRKDLRTLLAKAVIGRLSPRSSGG